MNYTEFTEAVCDKVREIYRSGDYAVEIQTTVKNNSVGLKGITIRKGGETVTPVIYLENYYTMYCDGTALEDIVNGVIQDEKTARVSFDVKLPDFKDFEQFRNKVVCHIINTNRNAALLENVPHKEFLDLSIVYYCIVGEVNGSVASFMVHNSHLDIWNIDAETLHEEAMKNTFRISPARVIDMGKLLMEIADSLKGIEAEELLEHCSDYDEVPMYVLTNECRSYGAVGMLCEDILYDFGEKYGDFYILPSSVHEVIMVPVDEDDAREVENLCKIVHEVNVTQVPPEEILSEGVYCYRKLFGKISKLNFITANA